MNGRLGGWAVFLVLVTLISAGSAFALNLALGRFVVPDEVPERPTVAAPTLCINSMRLEVRWPPHWRFGGRCKIMGSTVWVLGQINSPRLAASNWG